MLTYDIERECCPTIRHEFTKKQEGDIKILLQLADDMVASAIASKMGEQSYMNFIQARETFRQTMCKLSENYVRVDKT